MYRKSNKLKIVDVVEKILVFVIQLNSLHMLWPYFECKSWFTNCKVLIKLQVYHSSILMVLQQVKLRELINND